MARLFLLQPDQQRLKRRSITIAPTTVARSKSGGWAGDPMWSHVIYYISCPPLTFLGVDMSKKYPLWRRTGSKTVYKGRLHVVEHDAILPNGEVTKYEVEHFATGAVAVLIRVDDKVVLAHQYRFPLDKWIYDLPGGAIDPGESIEEAAIRECREEVGIAPENIQKLGMFYPNPSRTDWPAHVFFSDSHVESKITLDDPSENVEKVLMPINDLKKLIDNHDIVDPSLLIAWYAAQDKGLLDILTKGKH